MNPYDYLDYPLRHARIKDTVRTPMALEMDRAALRAAYILRASQPHNDATIAELPGGGQVLPGDQVPVFRPNGAGGGQTYWCPGSTFATVNTNIPTLGFVSVANFGADLTGVASSVKAINQAVSAAVANGTYMVYFPPGLYKIDSTVNWPAGITFFGAAPQHTVGYHATTGPTKLLVTNMSFDVFYAASAYGLTWSNLDVEFTSTTGSGGNVWHFLACQNVKMFNSRVSGCYNGLYNDSSGDVVGYEIHLGPADIAVAAGTRYGFYHTAATGGNPNFSEWNNCDVSQGGSTNNQTVDGFVIANGYNSVTVNQGGSTQCYRGFWSTNAGGASPNFFVVNAGTSQNSAWGIKLDDGQVANFNNMLFTSDVATVVISSTYNSPLVAAVPVTFSNCQALATNGPAFDSAAPFINLVITGGNLAGIGGGVGHGVRLSGAGTAGAAQSNIVTISGVGISNVANDALHLSSTFLGVCTFNGNTCINGANGIYAEAGVSTNAQLTAVGNSFYNFGTAGINLNGWLSANNRISSNSGVNPGGVLTPPITNPVSTTFYQNKTGYDATVYLETPSGVSAVAVGNIVGSAVVATSVTAGQSFDVPAGAFIALTWMTTQPTWYWLGR